MNQQNVQCVARASKVEQLYRELGPVVYRRCLRILGDRAAAQDATQEVFVKLLSNMERLEDRATVLPWIYRVATNHCLNLRRDSRRRGDDLAAGDLENALESALSSCCPEAALRSQLVRKLLERFDEATRAIAVAVFVDGMNHEEVAETLGISRRTVSRKVDRFLVGARRFLGADTMPMTAAAH